MRVLGLGVRVLGLGVRVFGFKGGIAMRSLCDLTHTRMQSCQS